MQDHVAWVLPASPVWGQAGRPGDCGCGCARSWHTASAQEGGRCAGSGGGRGW